MLSLKIGNQTVEVSQAQTYSVDPGQNVFVEGLEGATYQVLMSDDGANMIIKVTEADNTEYEVVFEGFVNLLNAGDIIAQLNIDGELMAVTNFAEFADAMEASAAGGEPTGQNQNADFLVDGFDPNRSAADDGDNLRTSYDTQFGADEGNNRPVVDDVAFSQLEVYEGSAVQGPGETNIFEGQLLVTDLDAGDTHTFAYVPGTLAVTDNAGNIIDLVEDNISVVINPDGSFVVTGDFNDLAIDEDAVVTFQYTATDQTGLTSLPGTVTLTVNGTNDQPVIDDMNLNDSDATNTSVAHEQVRLDAVDDTEGYNDEYHPSIATLPDGGYVVTWQASFYMQPAEPLPEGTRGQEGYWQSQIYVQRFDANGDKVGEIRQVSVTDAQEERNYNPEVSGMDDGGYVITWQNYDYENSNYNEYNILAQRFDSADNKVGSEIVVNDQNSPSNDYDYDPAIATLADGSYIITWYGYNYDGYSSDQDIFAQRFDASGNKIGGEFQVNAEDQSNDNDYHPAIAALPDGGYIITWQGYDYDGNYNYHIYAQRFDSNDQKVGSEIQISPDGDYNDDNYQPDITVLNNGNYVITWQSYDYDNNYNGAERDIYARVFDNDGNALGDEFMVNDADDQNPNSTYDLYDGEPSISALQDGGFMVVWYSESYDEQNNYNYEIHGQKFDASGNKVGEVIDITDTVDYREYYPDIVGLDNGSYVVAWNADGYEYDDGRDYDDGQDYDSSIRVEQFATDNGNALYETHDSLDVPEVDDTQDESFNFFTGLLSVSDDDVNDTHIFHVVEDEEGQPILDINAPVELNNIDVRLVQNEGGEWVYEIEGDFSALREGESATISFEYYADDQRGFDGTDGENESSLSEPKTIIFTITGTNDQPIVEDVTYGGAVDGVEATVMDADTIHESHDDTDVIGVDDTQEDILTVYTNTLPDITNPEEDVNDTHQYFIEGESVNVDNELITDFNVQIVDPDTGDFQLSGDFNALATGETATVSFQYYVQDDSGQSLPGETNTSELKTAYITITGTNDQPIVEDVNLNGEGEVIVQTEGTGIIENVDGNHSIATAYNIDGNFILQSNPDVGQSDTVPHVSIQGVGNSAKDVYEFTVTNAGDRAVFDIDYGRNYGGSFDPWLNLYDANGVRLAYDDDSSTSSGAGGSYHSYDSYLTYTFNEPGTYYIEVGRYYNTTVPTGGTYTLQVSLENAIMSHDGNVLYETHDDTDVIGVDDTTDDGNNIYTGQLSASDDDVNDTHTFYMAENGITVVDSPVDSDNNPIITIDDLAITINPDGSYSVGGDFTELAAGETVTVEVEYYALDNQGMDGTDGLNETSESEHKTLSFTITGTNDQPIVDDIVMGVEDTIYESADPDYDHDTLDDVLTTLSGTLTGIDQDVNDTLVFETQNLSVDSQLVTLNQINLTNNTHEDGTPRSADFSLTGDFNALAAGETATVTFQYRAIDDSAFQTPGESEASEWKTVSITVTGTNDQPIVEDVILGIGEGDASVWSENLIVNPDAEENVDGWTGSGLYWQPYNGDDGGTPLGTEHLGDHAYAGYRSLVNVYQTINIPNDVENFLLSADMGRVQTDTSELKVVFFDAQGNEVGSFTTGEITSGNTDSEISRTEMSHEEIIEDIPDGAVTAHVHMIMVANEGSWAGGVIDNVVFKVGSSSQESGTIYESADPDYDHDTLDDVLTTLSGTLEGMDQDVNDTLVFETQNLSVDSQLVTLNQINLTNNTHDDGTPRSADFSLTGDFNALAAGETATVTFQYRAIDDSAFQTPGESEASEWKTVSITVTGTNDQPMVSDVVMGVESVIYESDDPDYDHDTLDDVLTTLSGTLTGIDQDVNDTLVFETQNLSVDSQLVTLNQINLTNNAHEDGTPRSADFSLTGDFNALAAGETATVTFQYRAIDDSAFQTPGESEASEWKTVSITVTGTNDQPIVQEVVMGQGDDLVYESADSDYDHDTLDDVSTTLSGTISVIDLDVTDQHHFYVVDTQGNYVENVRSIDGDLDMRDYISIESSDIDPSQIDLSSIELFNTSNWPNSDYFDSADQIGFDLNGNFNALAAGETATVTFSYVAMDDSWVGPNGESNISEPKTVTITVTGTNDQPMVSDVTVDSTSTMTYDNNNWFAPDNGITITGYANNGDEITPQVYNQGLGIDDGFLDSHQIDEAGRGFESIAFDLDNPTNTANVTLSAFSSSDDVNWEVYLGDTLVDSGSMSGDGYPYESVLNIDTDTVFDRIVLAPANDGSGWFDHNDGFYVKALEIENMIFESADPDYDHDTLDDVLTTLSGTLTGIDQDVNDTLVFETQNLSVDSQLVTLNQINLTNNAHEDGTPRSADFSLTGDFNALAAGETATVTFQYRAIDDSAFQTPGESEASEWKTVSITVTGTNDQPMVSDVTVDSTSTMTYDNNNWFAPDNGITITGYANNGDEITPQVYNQGLGIDDGFLDSHQIDEAGRGFESIAFDLDNPTNTANVTLSAFSSSDDVNWEVYLGDTLVDSGSMSGDGYPYESVLNIDTDTVFDRIVLAPANDGTFFAHNDGFYVKSLEVTSGTLIYESHDDEFYQNGSDDTQDDVLTTLSGTLTGIDQDVNDTLVFETQNLSVDSQLVTLNQINLTNNTHEDGTPRSADFSLTGDFNALAAGETATVTFQYRAIDDSAFQTPGESEASEWKTVSITVTGTNDQPIVDDIVMGVEDTIYESHDDEFYQNGEDDTQDDVYTKVQGKLEAFDDDVNNTHVFNVRDYTASDYYGQGQGGPGPNGDQGDIRFDDVDFFKKGPNNGSESVKMMIASDDVNVDDLDVTELIFKNNNAQDSEIDFDLKGNFNALAAGETATVTFEYIANDKEGFGANGDELNEASLSEPKLVTITITGTNDQPIIESIETKDALETDLASVTYGADIDVAITDISPVPVEGSALKAVIDTADGDTVSFDWSFLSGDMFYDTAAVIVDGVVVGQIDTSSTVTSGTFTTDPLSAGEHTITLVVINDRMDDGDTVYNAELEISNPTTNGVPIAFETIGAVSGNAVDGWNISANSNLPIVDLDAFIDTQAVTYENAHLSGNLDQEELVDVSDDDVNDDYTFVAFDDRIVDFVEYHNDPTDQAIITTPIRVSVDENGNYDVISSSFDKLGYGDRVEITFDIQVRDTSGVTDGGTTNDEDPISEPKTVTVVIEGTNDQPVIQSVTTDNLMETDLVDVPVWFVNVEDSLVFEGQLNEIVTDEDFNDSYEFIEQGQSIFNPAFANVVDTNGVIHGHTFLKVDADGSYDVFNPTFNNLGTGESVTVSFDVQVTDGTNDPNGEPAVSASNTVEFTITGTNDQPVVVDRHYIGPWGAVESFGDGETIINGNFLGFDEDTNDVLTYDVVSMDRNELVTDIAGAGYVRVMNVPYDSDGNGAYEGNVDIAVRLAPNSEVNIDDIDITGIKVDGNNFTLEGDFNALPRGEFMMVKFQYNAQDDSGVGTGNALDESSISETKMVTISVAGTNDIADIHVGAGQADGDVAEDMVFETDGQLLITDLDAGEAEFSTNFVEHRTTNYGTFEIHTDGTWVYRLDNAAAQELNEGTVINEAFTVYSEDGTAHQLILVRIHGNEDSSQIWVDSTVPDMDHGIVTEDVDVSTQPATLGMLLANGSLSIIDVDQGDAQFSTTVNPLGTTLGTLVIDANGNWSYEVDNSDPSVQALGVGETIVEQFEVSSVDSLQGDTHVVTITINGTNDNPVITVNTEDPDALFIEMQGVDTGANAVIITNTINISDIDGDNLKSAVVTIDNLQDGDQLLFDDLGGLITGTYDSVSGTLTLLAVDQTNGASLDLFEYALNSVKFNNASDTPDESDRIINYRVTDIHDGVSNIATETVQVNDTNDIPDAVDDNYVMDITMLGPDLIVNGSFEDPDISANSWEHFANGNVPGWTAGDQTEIWDNLEGQQASDGDQNAELDYDSQIDTLSQTVSGLQEGQEYVITFDAAMRDAATMDNEFKVLWNGTEVATITEAQMLDGDWTTFNFTVDAINGDNMLSFVETSTDNYGPLLDNVKLQEVVDLETNEDHSVTFPTAMILVNDTDLDGDTLTVISVQDESSGDAVLNPDGTITYTPEPDFNGEATFTYTITDGNGGTDTATVTLMVHPVNDAPVAIDDVSATNQDNTIVIDVLHNDYDVDGDTLSISSFTQPTQGTVSLTTDGKLEFDPNDVFDSLAAGETAVVDFEYTISDGNGGFNTATVEVTVTGTNEAPVISLNAGTNVHFVSQDAGYANVLIAYELDGSNNPINPHLALENTHSQTAGSLTSILGSTPADTHFAIIANGQGELNSSSGNFSFDSSGNLLLDGSAISAPVYFDHDGSANRFQTINNPDGTITLRIEDANDGDYNDLVVRLVENGVTGGITELPDGDPLENNTTLATGGQMIFDDIDLTDVHTVDATPADSGYIGTFTPTINPVATGAEAGAIQWTFEVDDVTIDSMREGETVTQTYTVVVDDGNGGTDTQDVTVTITGTNDRPIVQALPNETGMESASTTLSIFDGNLSAVADVDSDDMHMYSQYGSTVTVDSGDVDSSLLTGVAVQVYGSGEYQVRGNFEALSDGDEATVTFQYVATDNSGAANAQSVPQTVTLTITGTNDAPVIENVLVNVAENDLTVQDPTDIDPANENATFTSTDPIVSTNDVNDSYTFMLNGPVSTSDTNGVISTPSIVNIAPDGNYTVTNTDFNKLAVGETATVMFNALVSDGSAFDTSMVMMTIAGSNDKPTVTSESITAVDETNGLQLIHTGLLGVDDIDTSDTHTFGITTPFTVVVYDTDGTTDITSQVALSDVDVVITDTATGAYKVEGNFDALADGQTAVISFGYKATDSSGTTNAQSDEGTITLTVNGTNDAPVATNDTAIAGLEDTPMIILASDLLANDSDLDSTDTLSITNVSVSSGTASVNVDGNIEFTPANNAHGDVTLTYTVDDGNGGTDTATTTINVAAQADAPVLDVDVTMTQYNPAIPGTEDLDLATDVDMYAYGNDSGRSIGFGWYTTDDNPEPPVSGNILNITNLGDDGATLSVSGDGYGVTDEYQLTYWNWGWHTTTQSESTSEGAQRIEPNEEIVIDLKDPVDSATITLTHAYHDHPFVRAYDANGVFINTFTLAGPPPSHEGDVELEVDPGGNRMVQYLVLSATNSSDSGALGFSLKGIEVGDPANAQPESWDYQVDVHAVLSDTDGSETLSNVVVTLPDSTTQTVTLDGNGDGSVTYNSDTQITDTSVFSASVTATEGSNNDEATVEATDDSFIFTADNEGFMLDFDNVDDADLPKVDEIDLSASGEHILSNLSLDDFLAMTDDDTLKISGDDITTDSITGLADNGWVEDTTPTVTETGYTTWTNAADTSVQLLIDDDIDVVS